MTTNGYPTTPDERALLARDVHAHLPEDRRVQLRADDLERLAAGLPNTYSPNDVVDALARWTSPNDPGGLPWTTTRSGFDAVVAARARREEPRGILEKYDPASRVVTGIAMPAYAVSHHPGHIVTHTGQMDVVSLDVNDVAVHWGHVTGVRCGALVGIERRAEGLQVWLELRAGELEGRMLALVDLGRVGLSAGFKARMGPEAGSGSRARRAEGMRLGEVSLTDRPAFGLADTAVKRVADVPRFAAEALRRERSDELNLRALEVGAAPSGRAAGRQQVRTFPGAKITVR
ncbi:hypothetical protein GCM10009809_38260 [Isoptericola hypogeus]|uniref:Uncharacterized protein n=1 Tax=Isoptericola hypogeus TaxID=300179 RepID=A0ABN2JWF8_9MICO